MMMVIGSIMLVVMVVMMMMMMNNQCTPAFSGHSHEGSSLGTAPLINSWMICVIYSIALKYDPDYAL